MIAAVLAFISSEFLTLDFAIAMAATVLGPFVSIGLLTVIINWLADML